MTFPPPPPRGQLSCRSKQGTWLGRGRGGCWQLPGIGGDGTGPACSVQDGGRSRGWGHCLVPVVPVLGSCCALICLFLPQASAGWPGAMRCSPKRCLTAALTAFVLLLLFLLLHRGSWQEQEPLEVSPAPVSSHWRGGLGCPPLHIPCLPASCGSSRLVLLPPLSRGIPSSAFSPPWRCSVRLGLPRSRIWEGRIWGLSLALCSPHLMCVRLSAPQALS